MIDAYQVMNSALQWVTGKTTYLVIIQKPTIYAAVGGLPEIRHTNEM